MTTTPERLGPYTIRRSIGRGGMGMVYEGFDVATGQTAAVKLLASDMAARSDFRERFEAEIESLRKLNHPNIVRMFGFGREDDHLYYAMEYVAGSSMEDQLSRGRVFDWREATQIGIDLARALRHAHDRGVIHRDIKPGNLLMAESGEVKLSDFGIARLFGNHRMTSIGSVLGTAEFMSPEQAEGKPVDPRSDLYSLGAVMYVMLARRPLFNATTFIEMLDRQRHEAPAPLHKFAPDVPRELEQIIHRLLQKDPNRRHTTATALARRLEDFAESHVVPEADDEESAARGANLLLPEPTHKPLVDPPIGSQPGSQSGSQPNSPSGLLRVTPLITAGNSPGKTPAPSIDQLAETRVEPHHGDIDLLSDSQSVLAIGPSSPQSPLTARPGPTLLQPPTSDVYASPSSDSGSSKSTSQESTSQELVSQKSMSQKSMLGSSGAESERPPSTESAAAQSPAKPDDERRGRFVTVTPGDLDHHGRRAPQSGPIGLQVILLSIALVVLGLAAWKFTRPLSADGLASRIDSKVADQSKDSLLAADDEVEQFLTRFPYDPRTEHFIELKWQILTLQLERRLELAAKGFGPSGTLSPVERAYRDALATSRIDPEAGAAQFNAIVDLYGNVLTGNASSGPANSPEAKKNNSTRLCVELALRRYVQLRKQVHELCDEDIAQIKKRLDDADAHANTPDESMAIYRAVIELYGNRRWAAPLVERAKTSLAKFPPQGQHP